MKKNNPEHETKKSSNKLCISRQNIFYSDIINANTYYAFIIRSPIKSGTIRKISHPDLPEDYKIITANDIPGKNEITINETTFPLLAYEKVSFLGEPIGILVGKDITVLLDLLKEIEIKTTSSTEQSKDHQSQNIIASRQISSGESDFIYTKSAIQFEKTYISKLQISNSKEILGAYAAYSKKQIQIYTPAKWASQIIHTASSALNCKISQISVIKTISEVNTTNFIYYTNELAILAALSCKLTEKNIKIIMSREETEQVVNKPVNVRTDFHFAIEEGGHIRAMNADVKIDVGFTCPFAQEITDRIVIALSAIYQFKNYSITAFAHTSNNYPLSHDFLLTDFQAFFPMESILQDISRQLHISPIDIRKINFTKNDKKSNYPIIVDNSPLQSTIDAVVKNSDFLRKYTSYTLAATKTNKNFPLRGIGLSCAFEGNGFYEEFDDATNSSMEITMAKNGNVILKAQRPSASIEKIWKDIVNEILEVEPDKIFIEEPDETIKKNSKLQSQPDNISILTDLIRKCCTQIKKQLFRTALPITVKRDLSKIKNKKWNSKEFRGEPFVNTSWVSIVTEIEIDRNTFAQNILAIWIVISAGEIFNKTTAVYSIKKSVTSTLKMCMPKYIFPNTLIHVEFIEEKKESKEIGRLIYNALPSSLTNALSVALQKDISVLPIESDTLYYSLKSDGVKKNENNF
ncbi:MAG: molybdopterin cofactor-binding domain-containing protein [Treponemataceae bacterium]